MVLPGAEARATDTEVVDGVPDVGRSVRSNEVRDHVVGQHHVACGAQDALWILRAEDFVGAVAVGECSVPLLVDAFQAFRPATYAESSFPKGESSSNASHHINGSKGKKESIQCGGRVSER